LITAVLALPNAELGEQIRYLHYSLRTEEAYVYWVKTSSGFMA